MPFEGYPGFEEALDALRRTVEEEGLSTRDHPVAGLVREALAERSLPGARAEDR